MKVSQISDLSARAGGFDAPELSARHNIRPLEPLRHLPEEHSASGSLF
jgi:hypothetical protein